jgi:hypothetical protein
MKKILVAVVALLNCCALAFAQKVDVMKSDFSALEPFTITYNAGGGPQGGALPSPWGTNLWNAGSKAETGVADEPTTKMRALYMTNTEGTPAVQMFTLKPLQLKANQNYLASFIYMTEGDATGRFEVRFEGEGADKMDRVGENLDRIGIWKERVVPFTTPASGLAGFQFSTGAVGKKIYIREFHLREGPKAWKPQPEELARPGTHRCETDYAKSSTLIHRTAKGRDKQLASSERAAKTFAAGPLENATSTLKAGITDLKSELGSPGCLSLKGFGCSTRRKVGGKAVDTLFVIAGSAPG